jgi:hypothetical protein
MLENAILIAKPRRKKMKKDSKNINYRQKSSFK